MIVVSDDFFSITNFVCFVLPSSAVTNIGISVTSCGSETFTISSVLPFTVTLDFSDSSITSTNPSDTLSIL